MIIDVVIRSPTEAPRHLSLDSSHLDPKGLSGAANLVDVLTLTGSVTRGSVVTGRVQTMTGELDQETGRAQVRIVGDGGAPLATIDTSRLAARGMVLTLAGPMSDPVIDEACGLGLHIGAAILARP